MKKLLLTVAFAAGLVAFTACDVINKEKDKLMNQISGHGSDDSKEEEAVVAEEENIAPEDVVDAHTGINNPSGSDADPVVNTDEPGEAAVEEPHTLEQDAQACALLLARREAAMDAEDYATANQLYQQIQQYEAQYRGNSDFFNRVLSLTSPSD